MIVTDYINSGVLHDYCIDLLSADEKAAVEKVCTRYPEVQAELDRLKNTIQTLTQADPKAPPAALQESIWNTLENINNEKKGVLADLPVINKYSDHNNWKRLVKPLMPEALNEDRVMIPIRASGGVIQLLVMSRTDVADETHELEKESFLVLEGECECQVGDQIIRLGPGGYIEIPLYTHHNVRVLSPYVVAVLQHVAL